MQQPKLSCHTASVLIGVAACAAIAAPASATETTFANPTPLGVPGVGTSGPASLYPSTILVSGLTTPVSKVTATITGFSHTFPNDVGAILVGPTGLRTALFNGAGSGIDAVNLTWTFDDDAASPLPSSGALSSGTFRPSNYFPGDNFPLAPAGPYATAMSIFLGADPNGDWSLYVYDFIGGDTGSISGGWSLTFTTVGVGGVIPEPATWAMLIVGFGLVGAALRRRTRLAPQG
ncbi:MAG: PEPxxWA-CTERM sorting domain-containing protein [Thermaurantiacus sp.]